MYSNPECVQWSVYRLTVCTGVSVQVYSDPGCVQGSVYRCTDLQCRWEREGARGWSYEEVLPYFKKAQSHSEGGGEYRGGAGPLHVTHYAGQGALDRAWLLAGQQAGAVPLSSPSPKSTLQYH